MKKIAVIGTGNLGTAIIEGLLGKNYLPAEDIYATRNKIDRLKSLQEKGVNVTQNNLEAVEACDIIILGVKPYMVEKVLEEMRLALDPKRHLVISVATGITLNTIEKAIGKELPIFRAMPNTAIATEESVTCICGKNDTPEQVQMITDIFNHVGITLWIKEELMEAATVIGACGIAYVLRFIRAMIQGGIEIGFDATTANTIVTQTVRGATDLLMKNGLHPEQEIDKVTTPKGCTIAGLNEMEHQGFSSALIKGIITSYDKIAKD